MEPTRLDSIPLDAPVRLSWAQKGDLLAQTLAAVVTTALIAAPLVGPSLTAERPLAARPVAELPPMVAQLDTPSAMRVARISARPRVVRPTVTDGTVADGGEAVSTIETAEMSASERPDSSPVGTTGVAKRERRTLGRRVASIFTGSGAYSVRPFPTVPATRH